MGEAVVRMLLVFLDKPILVESQLTKVVHALVPRLWDEGWPCQALQSRQGWAFPR